MSDTSTARILDAAIKSLRTEILPQLPDDAARIRFDQITRLLRAVSARLSKREAGLKALTQSEEAHSALGVPPINLPDASLDDLERERRQLQQAMSERIPALLEGAATRAEALQALERIVALEKSFYISQDPDIAGGSQVVYRGGRIDTEPSAGRGSPIIDETTLTAYLRRRFACNEVKAADVRVIPGGFSKVTFFFTLIDEREGSRKGLVMRKDMPVPFIGNAVVNEFRPLQHLHERGFPVAKPLWLETDAAVFGGSFIVSERVRGTTDSTRWAGDPQRARRACGELAKVLARLHAFAPQELGYPPELAKLSAGELMEREIDRWTRLFHAKKSDPLPLQEMPLLWLRRNVPKGLYERPARVIHGDVGFHNLMFDENGDVTALLDWEFSVLGDPTQDLCFARLFVDRLIGWRDFLEIYRAHGGVAPCEGTDFFFDLWTKTRNSVGCVDAQALFDTVMPDEVKFALAGHVFGPYLYVDECESLIAHFKQTQTGSSRSAKVETTDVDPI